MNKSALAIGVILAGLGAGQTRADPAYTKADILKHFAPPKTVATRGVCIAGADGQCGGSPAANPAVAPAKASPFDLDVTFQLNSDVLTSDAESNLKEFAAALKDPELSGNIFLIEGHTDARGSDRYNLILSQRRAKSVAKYLAAQGVRNKQLRIIGVGKENPRVPDIYDPANRRVEAKVVE